MDERKINNRYDDKIEKWKIMGGWGGVAAIVVTMGAIVSIPFITDRENPYEKLVPEYLAAVETLDTLRNNEFQNFGDKLPYQPDYISQGLVKAESELAYLSSDETISRIEGDITDMGEKDDRVRAYNNFEEETRSRKNHTRGLMIGAGGLGGLCFSSIPLSKYLYNRKRKKEIRLLEDATNQEAA